MCQICKKNQLHPALIVMCDKGHIDDFPWISGLIRKKISYHVNQILFYDFIHLTPHKVCLIIRLNAWIVLNRKMFATSKGSLQKIISKLKEIARGLISENCDQVPRGIQTRNLSIYFSSVLVQYI